MSSRARSRFAVLATVVPLILTAAPFVAPALAADATVSAAHLANGQVLGPYAGYLGAGIGQNGTTEVFRIGVSSTESTVSGVQLVLTGDSTQISLLNDFDNGDGFALYANTDNQPGFSALDKQNGLRSTGWSRVTTRGNGDTVIRVDLPGPVSGRTDYFLTAHPKAEPFRAMRSFTLQVEPNMITGSDNGPTSTVSTPTGVNRLRIDSQAPGAPSKGFFTPVSQPAGEEDSYLVNRSANPEAGARVAFYNNASDTAEASILTRPNGALVSDFVLPSDPTQGSKEILIGDGTGLNSANPVARNNQRSNNVYVRLLDAVGNFSNPTSLLMKYPNTESDQTARGNIVGGPAKPTSATLSDINAASVAAVNVNNKSAATVAGASDNTSSAATTMSARIVQLAGDGTPDLTKTTAWHTTAFVSNTTSGTNIAVDTRPVAGPPAFTGIAEGATAVGQIANIDALGNTSEIVTSASKVKDTVYPVLTAVEATRAGAAQPGDQVTLRFSEALDKTDVADQGAAATGSGDEERCEPPPTQTGVPPKSVHNIFLIQTAGGAKRSWGYNACFRWSADGTAATVRVGEHEPETPHPGIGCGPTSTPCAALFSTNDLVVPAGTLAAPKVSDIAGNQVLGLDHPSGQIGSTTIGSTTAFWLEAITNDLNEDGSLDSVDVTFSAPIDNANFATYQPNLSVVGTATLPVDAVTYVNPADKTKVRFSFGPGLGTGELPKIVLVRPASGPTGLVTAEVTPREVLPFTALPLDGAAPRPQVVSYLDSNRDGHIDQVAVQYSEPIVHANDYNGSGVAASGYKVPGYENHPASPQTATSNSVTPVSGNTATKTVALKPSASFDTGSLGVSLIFTPYTNAMPSVACATSPCTQWDVAQNKADQIGDAGAEAGFTRPVADAAAPAILSRTTRDLDNDGRIDAIDVKFSEALSSPSIGTAVFVVTDRQLLDQFEVTGNVIRLVINEAAAGDTDAKPAVSYQGGVSDTQGNVTAADPATPPATTDGAGPAIVAACPSSPAPNNGSCPVGDDGTKLLVVFSEPLAAASVQQADFVVEQPAGMVKAQNAAPAYTAGTKNVTLSFAPDAAAPAAPTAIDETKDAFVKLAADAAVTDVATNPSHQTSPVTAFALPVVTLDLSCPTAAGAGFCGTTVVNTGAAGSSGVSLWRLSETARIAAPPESEFSSAQPTTFDVLTEGAHTLYLSGKDSVGRLSPEVSQTITIIKAPKIQDVQFVIPNTRRAGSWSKANTVVDGDNVSIGADAVGSDAAQWATTTSSGGCKQANMSIDVRALTKVATHSAVAPFRCNLVGTTPPHREMQFPVVKAIGTTRYPIGTVIKTSSSDPGALIVDGPNGIQLRRHFISVNARRSHQITDASVITVTTAARDGVKRGSGIGYRDGAIVKTAGSGYYYMYANIKRPVSTATLAAWRISTSRAYTLSAAEFRAMGTGVGLGAGAHAVGTWIKFSNGSIQQIVRNAQGVVVRRGVGSTAALATLVPSTQIYPANSKDAVIPFDTFLRGYRDGTLLKLSGGRYGVVARASLRVFSNFETFNTLGYSTSSARSANGAAMPRVQNTNYRVGEPIDRYMLAPAVVITVKNMGGSTVQATVPNAGGMFGVGTLDPAPIGWDFTRG